MVTTALATAYAIRKAHPLVRAGAYLVIGVALIVTALTN